MKRNLTTALFFLILSTISAQDPKEIFKKSYEKCQSIKNGLYEMTRYNKNMVHKDTTESVFYCNFKKLDHDKKSPALFHLSEFRNGKPMRDDIYTGNEYVSLYASDSTGTIMLNSKWAEEIKSRIEDCEFFSPLVNVSDSKIPHGGNLKSAKKIFKYLGEEVIKNVPCYHLEYNLVPDKRNPKDPSYLTRAEYHFWIQKSDFLPLQYSIAYDIEMNNDTMYQYDLFRLDTYGLNMAKDESLFSLSSIPSYYRLNNYEPYREPRPLPKDTIAPDWTLTSLSNEVISLHNLKGQLVLIDFFYKGCYPCMMALPALQSLHEKYKSAGLKVIGIDPFDKKEEIEGFLSKRGVNYTILLDGKEVANSYKVHGYPHMFMINKTGKIVYIVNGYGESVDKLLDRAIQENL